ncbi:MAG: hypothetical protein FWD15_04960 [Alphaproteobacteria bacterium]|nr:hypothetical protein [Alphaproteobacteria bacterium]
MKNRYKIFLAFAFMNISFEGVIGQIDQNRLEMERLNNTANTPGSYTQYVNSLNAQPAPEGTATPVAAPAPVDGAIAAADTPLGEAGSEAAPSGGNNRAISGALDLVGGAAAVGAGVWKGLSVDKWEQFARSVRACSGDVDVLRRTIHINYNRQAAQINLTLNDDGGITTVDVVSNPEYRILQ